MKLIVQPDETNLSLFDFLQIKFCDKKYSKRKVKGFIDAGYCFVQGRPERFYRTKVQAGSEVQLRVPKTEKTTVSILFDDDALLVINKPPKITCDERLVRELYKDHGPLYLVHRLDKETSGVVLLAKTESAFFYLQNQFEERKIEKHYIALVDGVLSASGQIENFLAPVARRQGAVKWGVQPKGFWASTSFTRLTCKKDASLVSLYPKTGRTHQLRVHLSSCKHPILGDFVYGQSFMCRYTPSRQLLHAYELRFLHPETSETMHIQAPIAEDIQDASHLLFGKKACEYLL